MTLEQSRYNLLVQPLAHPLQRLARWRRARVLQRHPIPDALWQQALNQLDVLHCLSDEDQRRLRDMATLFLHQKHFSGTHGFVVQPHMRVIIAAQACLLVLDLGLEYFRGWRGIVLYETGFLARHEFQDEDGLVHETADELDGESWDQGPVVLSWAEIDPALTRGPAREREQASPPSNVVLHEFAHKLDYLSGDANGCPPLHRDVQTARWKATFLEAYDALCASVDADQPTPIDAYAAESPAEMFAVATESFFEEPEHLRMVLPDLYRQLASFYRRDPAADRQTTSNAQTADSAP